jgi:hypothetical protein
LLGPLVRRSWTLVVARFNNLPEAQLEQFLFRAERISLAAITLGPRERALREHDAWM